MRLAICSGKEHAPLLTSGLRERIHRTISTLLIPTHFWSRLYPSSLWTNRMFSFCNGKDVIFSYAAAAAAAAAAEMTTITMTYSKKFKAPFFTYRTLQMTVWLCDLIYFAYFALQQPNQSINIMVNTAHCLRCIFYTYVVLVGSSPIIIGVVLSHWLVCYLLPSYTFDFTGGSWEEI